MASATCPVCKQIVSTTHPMQTIRAQMTYHLRTHGLKGHELKRTLNTIKSEA